MRSPFTASVFTACAVCLFGVQSALNATATVTAQQVARVLRWDQVYVQPGLFKAETGDRAASMRRLCRMAEQHSGNAVKLVLLSSQFSPSKLEDFVARLQADLKIGNQGLIVVSPTDLQVIQPGLPGEFGIMIRLQSMEALKRSGQIAAAGSALKMLPFAVERHNAYSGAPLWKGALAVVGYKEVPDFFIVFLFVSGGLLLAVALILRLSARRRRTVSSEGPAAASKASALSVTGVSGGGGALESELTLRFQRVHALLSYAPSGPRKSEADRLYSQAMETLEPSEQQSTSAAADGGARETLADDLLQRAEALLIRGEQPASPG